MTSPISRFSNSRTRCSPERRHTTIPLFESQLLRDLLHRVALDVVADLELAEALDANAAFHAGAHFVDFVLEAAQRLGDAFVDDFLAAAHADLAFDDAAAGHHAAGDRRALGQGEDLAHFGRADVTSFRSGSSRPAMASFTWSISS